MSSCTCGETKCPEDCLPTELINELTNAGTILDPKRVKELEDHILRLEGAFSVLWTEYLQKEGSAYSSIALTIKDLSEIIDRLALEVMATQKILIKKKILTTKQLERACNELHAEASGEMERVSKEEKE